jgi:hypothetical protein
LIPSQLTVIPVYTRRIWGSSGFKIKHTGI